MSNKKRRMRNASAVEDGARCFSKIRIAIKPPTGDRYGTLRKAPDIDRR
jgi:hypothetical protein